jgi:hypothetical protein
VVANEIPIAGTGHSPEVHGWMFAGLDLLWQAGRLAWLVLGGRTADALGIRPVYYLGGVLLLVRVRRALRVCRLSLGNTKTAVSWISKPRQAGLREA